MRTYHSIKAFIGGYRIAQCVACGAFAVTFAKVARINHHEKEAKWLKKTRTPEQVKADEEYYDMLRAWYTKNGWTYGG